MESVRDNPALNQVFGLFQDFQKTGQFSRLLLETRGGSVTAHLSVQCSPPWTWTESARPTETRKPRRSTPSRRRRNKARREEWLAKKAAETKDKVVENATLNQDKSVSEIEKRKNTKVVNKSAASVDLTTKDLKVLPEGKSTKLVKTFKDSVKNSQNFAVIEQIDGQTESFDEIISAVQLDGGLEPSENPEDEAEESRGRQRKWFLERKCYQKG